MQEKEPIMVVWCKFKVKSLSTDMLSDPKIAGQFRKNSSGHVTQIFFSNHENLNCPPLDHIIFN